MLWQKGQAVRDHRGAGGRQLFGARHVHAFAFFLAQEHLAAAGAAAEGALAGARRIGELRRSGAATVRGSSYTPR